ncbi:putative pilus assembly protein [Thioalkalivibrio nitratireducens DSM 14787]|uniref:Pilus assembly protein n=1 Tax=Thioalkalivibrio nitratireducens (strain DSM 14787 / UNIQEM 213 / ALEN2) TaxID=1255043 RepID=L0DYU9_THIND|nr:tetratricopeptide repeat protein [Thioalkalivibrio nitratireducens]AGA34140.1 putative pilus assembly protein [Thioalkalivibrio nitratireducens DSM 14787]
MAERFRLAWWLLVPLLASGCATVGDRLGKSERADREACASELDQDQKLTLNVVDQLVGDGRQYAALARLDTMPAELPEVALKRAQILRRIGRDEEAEQEFQRSLARCSSGHAHHGLGLLRADAGDYRAAAEHLKLAREHLPVDPRIRNDYGFVLMVLGETEEAHFELMSAMDLSDGDRRPIHNLLLLYFSEERIDAATALISRHGLSRSEVAEVELRVDELELLRGQRLPAAASRTDRNASADAPVEGRDSGERDSRPESSDGRLSPDELAMPPGMRSRPAR